MKRLKLLGIVIILLFLSSCGDGGVTPPTPSTVKLPETGQTTCYDASGSVIDCATQGQTQDGAVLAGITWPTPRFTDNGDGTVTDNLTGLIWLKDGNCFGLRLWHAARLDSNGLADGTCGLTDSSAAGDWRLPNVNELESLLNAEESVFTWLNSQGFINVQSSSYWSSTTLLADTLRAFCVFMWSGGSGFSVSAVVKTDGSYVLPVRASTTPPAQLWKTGQTTSYATGDDGDLQRGVSWPSPRFTNNGDGTIKDNLTGLIWTEDANTPGPAGCKAGSTIMIWQDALDYVACLNTNSYLGYNDWRLPNRKELHSLTDFSQSSPALPSGYPFTNVQSSSYWSSTTFVNFPSAAWFLGMWDGSIGVKVKSDSIHIWPVRAGQ